MIKEKDLSQEFTVDNTLSGELIKQEKKDHESIFECKQRIKMWSDYIKYGRQPDFDIFGKTSSDYEEMHGCGCPKEMSEYLSKKLDETSQLRKVLNKCTTKKSFYKRPIIERDFKCGWTDIGRNNQEEKISFKMKDFAFGEIYSTAIATQSMLQEHTETLIEWIVNETYNTMSRFETEGFLFGDGRNKPEGILKFNQIVSKYQDSENILEGDETYLEQIQEVVENLNIKEYSEEKVDQILDMFRRFVLNLQSCYRTNGTFIISRALVSDILRVQFNSDRNRNILENSLVNNGQYTLLNYPVLVFDEMDEEYSNDIVFGDLKQGYIFVEKSDTRIIRDPYSYKPYIVFYISKKIGGGICNPSSMKILKIQ